MSKIYKILLAILIVSISLNVSAQDYWSARTAGTVTATDKAVARQSFPTEYKLFALNVDPLRQQLFSIVGDLASRHSTIISLPNADGGTEQFEVFEASNFEPALQARFPEIRAFSGRGITDRSATLKLSISPQGIQTMVFRTEKNNEFIEPYSQDHTVYAVFKSSRAAGQLPWACSTQDQQIDAGLRNQLGQTNRPNSSAGQLKTMRLAQSCNGEYSNFFGATSAAQVALVLAAFNATLTRCNGCYEKDLAIHLNLIANTTAVIYYDPATDPYTTLANWNNQLQAALTANIGEANYDIGHMFGASGGGGNAGCIGCVCVDGQKGRGITSPADGIPQGDNFDIDYVAHEVGHQMGGNHTFSMSTEGTGVNKEVGSGITIMGYAGITSQDVAPHSIDIFHEASIDQIQVNMAGKTCPITTALTGINATPVVTPGVNWTIPISTPFYLTGVASDADAGDVLTYCWEQNDDGTGFTGNNSVAFPTKAGGPNWLSFSPTTNTTRLFPKLSTILAGLSVTPVLPGGDAVANIEALSSVGRNLNFRLTVRDNRPYNGTAVGQTSFTNSVITVSAAVGPFLISSQNAAVSYDAGTTQTVTWSVNGTTGAPTNTANVKISWSTDGGNTFPTVLAASTPNDGTETFVVPATLTTQGRIKVEAVGNVYFDINNANITVTTPPVGFTFGATTPTTSACPAAATLNVTLPVVSNGGYVQPVTLAATAGVPAGTTITFATNPVTPGNNATVTLNNANTLAAGTYVVTIQGTAAAPAVTQTANVTFTVNAGAGPAIGTQPTAVAACAGANASFSVVSATATGYQWQVSTNGGVSYTNVAGGTAATLNLTNVQAANAGLYQVIVTGQCGTTTSAAVALTVNTAPAITTNPVNFSTCSGNNATFTVAATGSAVTYQWQESTNGGGLYTNITNGGIYSGATTNTLILSGITATQSGYLYRCVATGTCAPAATSTGALLTVQNAITVTTNPTNVTLCEGSNATFTVAGAGSSLSYQWQVSTNGGGSFANVANGGVYSGANLATLTITGATASLSTYQYRCIISNGLCVPGTSSAATLTVNTFANITSSPANITVCEGTTTQVAVTATGTGLTYQWQISTNAGASYSNLAGGTASTWPLAVVTVGQSGQRYRVVVTNSCGPLNSGAAILTVNPNPTVTINNLPTSVCLSDGSFGLSVTASATGAWSGAGVSGSTFSPSAAGLGTKAVTYTVTTAGCTTAKTSVVQVNECAERHLRLNQFPAVLIYPVPNDGHFSIQLNTDLYTKLGVKVFNSMGQLVHSEAVSGVGYGSVIPVDISRLPNGGYHLYLTNSENGDVSTGRSILVLHR